MNLHNLINLDPTVLDGVDLVPKGISADLLKSEIVLQCGLLRPVYPEPDVFKELCIQFFQARSWEFKHLLNIINAEYSPIDNVSEERTETRDISRKHDRTDTRTINRDVSEEGKENASEEREETTDSNSSTNGNTENTVSAFNSDSYQPDNKSVSTSDANASVNTEGSTRTNKNDSKKIDDDTLDKLQGAANEESKDIFTVKRHGNIGVTTNFELIKGELSLLNEFNLYKWIALQFRSTMMIEVF